MAKMWTKQHYLAQNHSCFLKNVTPDKNALHFSYAFLKSPHEPVCSPGISLGQEYERRNETNGM